jgi:hypothetical protein
VVAHSHSAFSRPDQAGRESRLQGWAKADTGEKIAVHPSIGGRGALLKQQGLLCKADNPVRWQSLDRAARVSPLNEIATEMAKRITGSQSRLLDVGAPVCWRDDKSDLGTVTEKDWAGVTVKWDNRSQQTVLHNDMACVGLVSKK